MSQNDTSNNNNVFWGLLIALSAVFAVCIITILFISVKDANESYRAGYVSDVSTWVQDVADHSEPSELRNAFITNVEKFTDDGAISDDEYKILARDYKLLKESVGITAIENNLMKIRMREGVPLMITENDIAVDLPFEALPEPINQEGDDTDDYDDQARTAVDEEPTN